jgi:protein-disulfide isomerase
MIPRRALIGVMGAGLLAPTVGRKLFHQAAVETGASPSQASAIARHRRQLFGDPADPVEGNPLGRIAVVEFYDPRCPYCKAMRPVMRRLVETDRSIRLIQKTVAMLGPDSVLEASVIIAAGLQGGAIPMRAWIMDQGAPPSLDAMLAAARHRKLDVAKLKAGMDGKTVQHILSANLALAAALGIDGTPAFVIGTTLIPGAVSLAAMRGVIAASA